MVVVFASSQKPVAVLCYTWSSRQGSGHSVRERCTRAPAGGTQEARSPESPIVTWTAVAAFIPSQRARSSTGRETDS